MSTKAPLDIKALRKKGVFNEDRFFTLLSQQCNYVDKETVRHFYMGLVRHITKELRENGVIKLPHLGYFAVVRQKAASLWAGKYKRVLDRVYVIKFYVNATWKGYFTELSKKPGKEGLLDPREKLLGREIETKAKEEQIDF